jgi:coproporphyrinogen III oxidase
VNLNVKTSYENIQNEIQKYEKGKYINFDVILDNAKSFLEN